jgi:hypothetical protein
MLIFYRAKPGQVVNVTMDRGIPAVSDNLGTAFTVINTDDVKIVYAADLADDPLDGQLTYIALGDADCMRNISYTYGPQVEESLHQITRAVFSHSIFQAAGE